MITSEDLMKKLLRTVRKIFLVTFFIIIVLDFKGTSCVEMVSIRPGSGKNETMYAFVYYFLYSKSDRMYVRKKLASHTSEVATIYLSENFSSRARNDPGNIIIAHNIALQIKKDENSREMLDKM